MSLTPEQLKQRKSLITASDAAAILGLDRYRGPHAVWASKCTDAPPLEQSYAMRRGHAMEPLLLEWLAEQKAPLVVVPCGDVTRTHPIFPWLGATPDAVVFDPRDISRPIAIGEAKSTGRANDWTDEDGELCCPEYYLPQVVVQMSVVSVPRAFVVAEIIGEREPQILEVERDSELEAMVLEELDRFRRQYIEPRVPPPVDEETTYSEVAAMFRRPKRAALVPASHTADELAAAYLEVTRAKREAEEKADKIKAALCAEIGDAEGIAGETWKATWKERPSTVVSYERKAYRHFDLRAVGAKGDRS